MTVESHGAVVIEPNTIKDIGNVAQHILISKDGPAKPATINSIGICAPANT